MNLSLIEPLEARIAPAALSISPASIAENDTTHAISFTVSLDAAATSTVTVQFGTADGTAQASDFDYTARNGTLTFAAGETEHLVTIQIANDTKFEADETFVVNLSNAVGASIGTAQATGTIQNDDTAPTISISDLQGVSVAEGNAGTKVGNFSVSLSEVAGVPITVHARTVDGTAVAGEDFEAVDQMITIEPGQRTVLVPVTIKGDTTDESDETFTVELSDPSVGTIDDGTGTATILNDDRVVTIGDASIVEGDSGTQDLVFTVTLDAISDHAITIDYATVNGTAVQNGDFVPVSGTLTFDPGQLTKEITVKINGDTTGETDENFTVSLSNPKNVLVADATGLGTIINDDATLSIGDASVVEGSGNMVFTVTLAGANAGEVVTVDYQTADVTAVSTGTVALGTLDYTPAGGSIMLTADAEGNATGTITIEVLDDAVSESTIGGTTVTSERFNVAITSTDVAAITKATGLGTIIDDEGTFITIDDISVTEIDTGTANARFTVSLNRPAMTSVSVAYATAPGTADSTSSSPDFVARNGTLNFSIGQQFLFIDVPVNGDTIREMTEQFTVNLSNATNAAIGDATGRASIIDNDPVPTVTLENGTIVEGNDGTPQLVLVAKLSQPNEAETVTVAYSTINGIGPTGAMAGSDFVGVTDGMITFAPGQTTANITIDVLGDTVVEGNETFQVQLTNPQHAILGGTATATGTISNDDISASIADVTFTEGDSGETVQNMTVTLSAAPVDGSTVTVNYAVGSGTANSVTDYHLSDPTISPLVFGPGETTKTISFIVLGDALDENDETIPVSLTGATGAILGENKTATATIADDDPEPTLSIADAVLVEGNTGTSSMVFTLTLSGASAKPISVTASTMEGTALNNIDFTQIDGRVINFAAGETSKTFSVPIVGDTFDELDEAFSVHLSAATNATIANGTAVGTITDNDNSVITIANAAVAEGPAGQTSHLLFAVSVPNPAPTDIVVSYATSDGTATAGSDYKAATGTVTIPAGQTNATISIDVTGDNTFEPDETFTVTLSNPSGGSVLGQATATGTIQTDEVNYKLVPVMSTAAEETGTAPGQAIFKVVRAGADLTLPGSVSFKTADNDSAVANVDYVTQSGTLNFAAGETEKTITIDFKTDNARENSETFLVQLTGSTNGVLLDSANVVQTTLTGTATITDNDAIPVISISSPTVKEGNPDTNETTPDLTDLVFTVSLSAPNELDAVTVNFATMDGTAISTASGTMTADFQAQSGTLTFAPGETTMTIVVKVLQNDINELSAETMQVVLSGVQNATLSATDGTGTGTITDDDALTISLTGLTNGGASFTEGSTANLALKLNRASEQIITVDVATVGQTATVGSDFSRTDANGSPITFQPGQTTKALTYSLTEDQVAEQSETFRIDLANASGGATIATPTATVTIVDNDPIPVISVNSPTVSEGDSGTTDMVFTISLNGTSDRPISVNYATADGTASSTGAGPDYVPVAGMLVFQPGETTKTVVVKVNGDTVKEADETVLFNLSEVQNANPTSTSGTGTILNGADAMIGLSINDVKVVEGPLATGSQTANFTVTLSAPAEEAITFLASTRNGTAVGRSDFAEFTGREVTIAAGQTSATVTVSITGDTIFESTESFFVDVSGTPSSVQVVNGVGRGTIYNDDILQVNAQKVLYIDEDGDLATVRITKGALTIGGSQGVLTFSSPNAIGGRILQQIDFTSAPTTFNHTDVFVKAAPQPGFRASGGVSDGLVDVGYIQAGIPQGGLFQIFNNSDLGTVKVEGDLGKIVAGDQIASTRAIKVLNVVSHGERRLETGAPDNVSLALGGVTVMKIKDDLQGTFQAVGSYRGDIDQLKIGGALRGDERSDSGQVFVTGTLAQAKIGSIVGGTGSSSGLIFATFLTDSTINTGAFIGQIKVQGDIVGGGGANSGAVQGPSINKVVVGGDLMGGAGNASGTVQGGGKLNRVIIKGDLVGGIGNNSGEIFTGAFLNEVKVQGSILGGGGSDSGSVVSEKAIGTIKVAGDIQGGAGESSGTIQSSRKIGYLQLGESRVADSGDLEGGGGANSGQIRLEKSLQQGIIFGDIVGGTGSASGGMNIGGKAVNLRIDGDIVGGSTAAGSSTSLVNSGFVVAKRIVSMDLAGDLIAGTNGGTGQLAGSGSIRTSGDIVSLRIGGDVLGTDDNRALISAAGTAGGGSHQAIQSLNIKGSIALADIVAGYQQAVGGNVPLGTPDNPDAQIGKVKIIGTTEATNIVAGVIAGADGKFGTADDATIAGSNIDNDPKTRSAIAHVIFKGGIIPNDENYGVVAEIIRAAKVSDAKIPLKKSEPDEVVLGPTGSKFNLRELTVAG